MSTVEDGGGAQSVAETIGTVGRNAGILVGATLFCKAGSLFVVPFILRAFTREEYGTYSAAFAYAGLLGMIAYFGMNPIVIRDIVRGERSKGWVVFHAAAIRMGLLAVAGVVLAAVGLVKGFSAQMWGLAWLAYAVMGFDAVSGAVKASMQAEGRFGLMAIVEMVRKTGQWVLAIAVIFAGAGIVTLAAAVGIAAGAAMIAALVLGVSRADFSGMSFAPSYAIRMLRMAVPVGLSAAFVLALERVDIWAIDIFRGPADVGIYAAGTAFKPDFIAQCVVWAILPLAFKLAKNDPATLVIAVATTGRYLLVAGAALAMVFFCGGGTILPILAGAQYGESITVFQVMGLSLPFIFVSLLFVHALTAVDRQSVAAVIFAAGLVINVVLDVALVPSMGAAGAIIATFVTEVLIAIAGFVCVWRLVGRPFAAGDARAVVSIAAGAIVAGAMYAFGVSDLGAAGVVTLGVMLLATKAVGKNDVALLRSVISP